MKALIIILTLVMVFTILMAVAHYFIAFGIKSCYNFVTTNYGKSSFYKKFLITAENNFENNTYTAKIYSVIAIILFVIDLTIILCSR